MATKPAAATDKEPTGRRGYWSGELAKADKRFDTFHSDGDAVSDRFMLQARNPGDKYNILYSSTETIKPSLYGQTPKVEVKNRQTDTEDSIKVAAAMLLESVGQYCVDEVDFDYVLRNVVSDYVLPGLGTAWVRYDPNFAPMNDNEGKQEVGKDGQPREYLTGEKVALDYVYWKDMRWGSGRTWEELPWIARKVFFTKKKAQKRFGNTKAAALSYSYNVQDRNDRMSADNPKVQALIWEIWDRENGNVVWFSEDYPDDVLDQRSDPLKLKDFYPCPRPLRAVWVTRDFIPKSLYSQYKAQAAELDRLTERIRYLTEALKVRGLYDGSQEGLVNLLAGEGNKMVPIQDWAQFIGQGGVASAVQWVPIQEIANVLSELFKQREICKNEIYEITGFSDIVRGISKASETLGAQQIKADWATGRLKDMQREVQRFCRDLIRIMIEVACEHFSERTLLLYSGLKIPEPTQQEQQAARQALMEGQPAPPTQGQMVQQMFSQVVQLLRKDATRCASVDIETDSTILPDEEKERADRMQFLNSMGAFLQQAGPMALQYPDMRGLLGGIMMFTLRTFSAARPLEKEFEVFQQKLAAMPPQPPDGGKGQDGQAQAQATMQAAQLKTQADAQKTQADNATKMQEAQLRAQVDREKNAQDHQYRMAQIAIEREKLNLERTKLGLTALSEERQVEDDAADREYQRNVEAAAEQNSADQAAIDREDAREDAATAAEQEDRRQSLAEQAQEDAAAQAKVDSKAKKAD